MATYLTLARYTSEGMRAALAEGMTARRAVYEKVVGAVGGKLLSWHLLADGDWDIVTVGEFPDHMSNADAARMMATFRAAGTLAELRTLRLASAEDFDAASRAPEQTYVPPSA